jgi:hypothetical protein
MTKIQCYIISEGCDFKDLAFRYAGNCYVEKKSMVY